MTSITKIAKGAGIIFIGMILGKLFNLIFRAIVARLGTEQYGLFFLGLSVHGLILIFALIGMDYGVTRYVSHYIGKKDDKRIKGTIISALRIGLTTSLILSILTFILSNFISIHFFHNSSLAIIIKLFSITIPFSVMSSIALAIIRAYKKVGYIVYFNNILRNIIQIGLTIFLIYMGYSVVGVVWAFVISLLITVFSYYYIIETKIIGIFKSKIKSVLNSKELFYYSFPLTFVFMIISLVTWIDSIMIGRLNTISDVGIYNAALPIVMFMTMIPTALLTLFMPSINELYARRESKLISDICKTITKWIFYANLLLSLIIILFSKFILKILFGQEYTQGSIALIILTFGFFAFALSQTSTDILNMFKKTKLVSFNILIIILLNIGLNYFLIPQWGINGAAIATFFSLLVYMLLTIIESFHFSKINVFGRNILTIYDTHDKEIIDAIRGKFRLR